MDNRIDNKALAKQYLQLTFSLNTKAMAELMHDDFEGFFPTISLRPNQFNKSEMLEFLGKIPLALPQGIECNILELTAESDRVAVAVRGHAKTVDGTDYNNHYHFLLYMQDKQIIRHFEYFDSYLAAKVLGPILRRQG